MARRMCKFMWIYIGLVLLFNIYAEGKNTKVKIVVSRESPIIQIDEQDVSLIFLGKKTLWESDLRLSPAMLRENHPAMQSFIENVLHKSISQYRTYWRKLLFSGAGTVPKTFRRPEELYLYLESNPGAVGVTPADSEIPVGLRAVVVEGW